MYMIFYLPRIQYYSTVTRELGNSLCMELRTLAVSWHRNAAHRAARRGASWQRG
jgi:hypothetical protein